ncbi:hypothetical protein [Paraburkholderia tropica]|uniref:hypothetical protein n=1 Tax=Paraburkholderia tropica TaxID=92647 RepID=UPI003D2899DA
MIDKDITENFFISSSGAEREGKVYVCDVSVVRKSNGEIYATYRGEGRSGKEAESRAKGQAVKAITDGHSPVGEPRLAAEPRPHSKRSEPQQSAEQ